eukprot:COSAG01_NODE_58658_length_304_cov_3.004878_1_plen_34_part_01
MEVLPRVNTALALLTYLLTYTVVLLSLMLAPPRL